MTDLELEGCNELGLSSDVLAVSSCITPHGFVLCGQSSTMQTPPVQLPTGDTPHNLLLNSVNRSALLYRVFYDLFSL